MKTWLITGCSSGFGRNLAETLLSEGEQVIVTARKPKTIQHFAKNYPLTALCLRLDVTKKDTIDATVNAAIEKFGKIDVSSTTPVIVFAVPLRNAQKKKSTQSSTPTIMFPCFYNKAVLLAARLFNNFSMTVNANI